MDLLAGSDLPQIKPILDEKLDVFCIKGHYNYLYKKRKEKKKDTIIRLAHWSIRINNKSVFK